MGRASRMVLSLLMSSLLLVGVGATSAAAASRPSVSKVKATAGSTSGGTEITISGKNFTRVQHVRFGGVDATSYHVVSTKRLTAVAPPHASGRVDVTVVTTSGTSKVQKKDRFTYGPAPAVSSLSAQEATTTGGGALTLSGSAFDGTTKVLFGKVKASHLKVTSTSIRLQVPKHAAGLVDVTVTTRFGTSASTSRTRFSYYAPLTVATSTLPPGTAGARYLAPLEAKGGGAPYTWKASGLPAGLTLDPTGVVSGVPKAQKSSDVTFSVADSANHIATRTLKVAVATTLPDQCLDGSCAAYTPNGHTVEIAADRVLSIVRDDDQQPTTVVLTGDAPSLDDVLVLAPGDQAPSGLVAVVRGLEVRQDGTTAVSVVKSAPAVAFASGALSGEGSVAAPLDPTSGGGRHSDGGSSPQRRAAAPKLSCNGGVTSSLHGLDVSPSLTPSVSALWKHPLFGGDGVYVGTGGLDLFQFDLDGDITVDLGATISGAATCSLKLPSYHAAVPAGQLGAVLLDLDPTVTFAVSGKVDLRETVTLHCGAEYRWDQGKEYRGSYCAQKRSPLQFSSDTGADASLTLKLDVSVTLDDIVGITGSITGTIHTGLRPTQHPLVEIDAKIKYEIGACLACLWKGSPARVTLVSGTLLDKVLYESDDQPPSPPGAGTPPATPAPTVRVSPGTVYDFNAKGCPGLTPTFPTAYSVSGEHFHPGSGYSVQLSGSGYVGGDETVNADGSLQGSRTYEPFWPAGTWPLQVTDLKGATAATQITLGGSVCWYPVSDGTALHIGAAGFGDYSESEEVEVRVDGDLIGTVASDLGSDVTADLSYACTAGTSHALTVAGTTSQFRLSETLNCGDATTAGTGAADLRVATAVRTR